MGLIYCPECGKQISDKSKRCINCGYPIQDYLIKLKIISKKNTLPNRNCPVCHDNNWELAKNGMIICSTCGFVCGVDKELENIWNQSHPTQRQQLQQEQNQPKCPTCSSTNVRKISASKKMAGAIGFGLLSKTARSTFGCLDCKYKW